MAMGQAELGVSKPVSFPAYCRSHFRSQTYLTLSSIFCHLPAIPDNGSGRMEQEKLEKGPEFSEFVGSASVDPKDPVPEKIVQEVHETTEGVGDKGRESSTNDVVLRDIERMLGIEEVEDTLGRQPVVMPKQENNFKEKQRIMDDGELAVEGTEDLLCDSGLISMNLGRDEKQDGSSEVELMDYQVEHVEFQHSDVNKSGNASDLQLQGELNQLASESFHPPLIVDLSTSTKGQASALVKTVCATMDSLPNTKEGEFEEEEYSCPKVSEALPISSNHTISEAFNACKDERLLEVNNASNSVDIQIERGYMEEGKLASNSSSILMEKGDTEEGELSGDFGIGGNLFDMSSAYSLKLHHNKTDEVQKSKSVVKDIVFPCKIGNGEKDGYEYNSFIVNTHEDGPNSRQVEPRTSTKSMFALGVEVEISPEAVKFDNAGEYDFVPKPKNSKDSEVGRTNFARDQVSYTELWDEDAYQDHANSSASKHKADVSSKKKRGPGSEERKAKRKQKKRKKRAEKNAQLGVKRLKLPPAKKLKTVAYCRHYLVGRCHEGDKCQFSHDTVPLTKSKPCCHFARHSCMKGDDCPFDHELSKYPCNNFVTIGFCNRGDACLFSHQISTKEDSPMPSKISRPVFKSPLLSRNTSLSVLPNSHGSSVQQKHVINSMGMCSLIHSEDEVSGSVQKQHTPAPRGINFINTAKSSLPSPSTPEQGLITPNKESLVQTGAGADQSASSTNQTLLEIPMKLPAAAPKGVNFLSFGKGSAPKGINFLSFGKGSVCSFKSSISSLSNKENGIKVPHFVNFGLPNNASSSLKKDDCSKAINGTKQSVLKTDLVTEVIKSIFPRKASADDATTDLQGSSYSHVDHSDSKSVQQAKKASDCSQTSIATSSMLLVSQFGQQRSSKCFPFRSQEHASDSGFCSSYH